MSAMALTFVACSSEDEVAQVNPTFDGKAVKAEFSINLPGKYATRMQTAITQDNGTLDAYRTIPQANIYLAPYVTAAQADANPVAVTDAKQGTVTLTEDLGLADHTNALDKWYKEVTVPVGTNAFVVYAQPEVSTEYAKNGSLTMSPADPFDNLANVKFELKPIVTGALDGSAIVQALNTLASTKGTPYVGKEEAAWSAIQAADNEFYANAYQTLISLKAGAKTDVLAFLNDFKAILKDNTGDAENGIDVKVKAAVQTAIDAVNAATDFTAVAGIPDGAAVLTFAEGAFKYVTTDFITGVKWGANSYAYPASLWYRVNTGIRASNEIQSTNVGDNTWKAFIEGLTAAEKNVTASTQSVALVNPLQYAVGNFEAQVKFEAAELKVMKEVVIDEATGTTEEKEVESVPVNKLTLTGILVGDQKNVDWQFKPLAGTDEAPVAAQVIYDTDLINKTFDADDYKKASQILVLETAEDQKAVNVALEFKNETGKAFTGKDGIVPANGKFYLIGQLNLADPSNVAADGATTGNAKLIFQQDYKTIAKFLVKKLEGTAYNTIPDLRAPKLEFGLSVDLTWQKGYTFDIVIGE